MPGALMRFGLFLMFAGLFSFLFHQSAIITGTVIGLGYILIVIGIILWSTVESGDVSFD